MEMHATRTLAADRATVWAALNDAETLKACIPGCEELTGTPEDGLRGHRQAEGRPGEGHLQGRRHALGRGARHQLHHLRRRQGRRRGLRQGRGAGRAADAEDGGTEPAYDVEAKVGGKIAQLGSRLIDSFARKMADQFFERFEAMWTAPMARNRRPKTTARVMLPEPRGVGPDKGKAAARRPLPPFIFPKIPRGEAQRPGGSAPEPAARSRSGVRQHARDLDPSGFREHARDFVLAHPLLASSRPADRRAPPPSPPDARRGSSRGRRPSASRNAGWRPSARGSSRRPAGKSSASSCGVCDMLRASSALSCLLAPDPRPGRAPRP
jgi:carbon monoxide dehydrogenase subunit G